MIYRVSYVLVNGVVVTKSFDANSKEDAKEQAWAEEEDHEISYIKEVIQSASQTVSHQVASIRTLEFVNLMKAWRDANTLNGPAAYDAITAHIDAKLRALQPIENTGYRKVGITDPMPGTGGGFTMATFKGADVPVGTELFVKK